MPLTTSMLLPHTYARLTSHHCRPLACLSPHSRRERRLHAWGGDSTCRCAQWIQANVGQCRHGPAQTSGTGFLVFSFFLFFTFFRICIPSRGCTKGPMVMTSSALWFLQNVPRHEYLRIARGPRTHALGCLTKLSCPTNVPRTPHPPTHPPPPHRIC